MRFWLFALAAPLLATGCESTQCKTAEVASVTVSIYDEAGDPVSPEYVTYTVDGSTETDCEPLGADETEYVCGYEEAGTFDITVVYMGSEYPGSVTVGMALDGCHVKSEFLDITVGG